MIGEDTTSPLGWFWHKRLCLHANQLVLTGEDQNTEEMRDKVAHYLLKWAGLAL